MIIKPIKTKTLIRNLQKMTKFVFLKNKIFSENNNLPALFFVLCAVAIPDFMVLSPQIMSLPFLLMGLSKILDRIANETTDVLFLYTGIHVGIATLFYPPAITYFFIFLISFFLFSSSKLRRIGLYFNGFLIPRGRGTRWFISNF